MFITSLAWGLLKVFFPDPSESIPYKVFSKFVCEIKILILLPFSVC